MNQRDDRRDRRDRDRDGDGEGGFSEKVVFINRVSKVVKGGRRFSFSAVVVVGDGRGQVGAGMGKANEVPEAIRKGAAIARKNLFRVPMVDNRTVPHAWRTRFGAAEVLIKPAPPGTGVIAGGGVRAVMEQAGVKDVVAKSLGSSNAVNVVRAAIKGLQELRDPETERQRRLEAQAAPTPEIREPRPERRVPREQRDRDRDRERPPREETSAEAEAADTAATAALSVSPDEAPAAADVVPAVEPAEATDTGPSAQGEPAEATEPVESPGELPAPDEPDAPVAAESDDAAVIAAADAAQDAVEEDEEAAESDAAEAGEGEGEAEADEGEGEVKRG